MLANTIQMHPSQSPSPAPTNVPTNVPVTSSRVARAIAELNTRYPTHRFSAKPDGGLVIDEIATGERATSCPDPECARVFAYKRSNCVSRHVQTEHAPDTLPFVCCSPCTSRTNRRDHFVAHLARKKAQCAAAILARWSESDIDLMMKLVYPNAARAGYGAWRQALVHDTNPEHLEAQLRKLGLSIAEVLGNSGAALTTSSTTPSLLPVPAAVPAAASALPPVPVSPLTHSVPVSMAAAFASPMPATMDAFAAPANNNMLVPDWAALTPPPPAPAATYMPEFQFQQQPYMPQRFTQPMISTPFPTLASSAWESWPPAPSPAATAAGFAPQPLMPLAPTAGSAATASPMIPPAADDATGSMTPDPFLPAQQTRVDFDPSPFLHAPCLSLTHPPGNALPSPATSPMTVASHMPTVINGMLSPLAPGFTTGAGASKKRSRAAAQVNESVTDYDALLFGFTTASSPMSGNGDSQPPAAKRFRTDTYPAAAAQQQLSQQAWLQLPSPVLAPMATY